jgi:hypothetical protein
MCNITLLYFCSYFINLKATNVEARSTSGLTVWGFNDVVPLGFDAM